MRTAISDQTEVSKRVAKQHQGLTQDAHGLGRPGHHLVAGGDRVPVATQQFAHFGAGPYLRQKLVVFRRHHVRALYIRERCSTRHIPPLSDTSPLYWMIGEALQKPSKCSLCLERGRLGIAIFSGFKNVLSSLKICDTFAFFQHCKQKSLSVRKFLKLLKRLLVH